MKVQHCGAAHRTTASESQRTGVNLPVTNLCSSGDRMDFIWVLLFPHTTQECAGSDANNPL